MKGKLDFWVDAEYDGEDGAVFEFRGGEVRVFKTIQAAVDAGGVGIHVVPGTYIEEISPPPIEGKERDAS